MLGCVWLHWLFEMPWHKIDIFWPFLYSVLTYVLYFNCILLVIPRSPQISLAKLDFVGRFGRRAGQNGWPYSIKVQVLFFSLPVIKIINQHLGTESNKYIFRWKAWASPEYAFTFLVLTTQANPIIQIGFFLFLLLPGFGNSGMSFVHSWTAMCFKIEREYQSIMLLCLVSAWFMVFEYSIVIHYEIRVLINKESEFWLKKILWLIVKKIFYFFTFNLLTLWNETRTFKKKMGFYFWYIFFLLLGYMCNF